MTKRPTPEDWAELEARFSRLQDDLADKWGVDADSLLPGMYVLDADNKPVRERNILTHARWMASHPERKQVGWDRVGDDLTVSTVFLGLDHNHHSEGPPILWETIIFKGASLHDGPERYTSHQEALEGHRAACAAARRMMN